MVLELVDIVLASFLLTLGHALTNTFSSFSCVTHLTLVYWVILYAFFLC